MIYVNIATIDGYLFVLQEEWVRKMGIGEKSREWKRSHRLFNNKSVKSVLNEELSGFIIQFNSFFHPHKFKVGSDRGNVFSSFELVEIVWRILVRENSRFGETWVSSNLGNYWPQIFNLGEDLKVVSRSNRFEIENLKFIISKSYCSRDAKNILFIFGWNHNRVWSFLF